MRTHPDPFSPRTVRASLLRRSFAVALLGFSAVAAAQPATPDSVRARTVQVTVPTNGGVLYYRAGGSAPARRATAPAAPPAATTSRRRAAPSADDPVTRLDLLLLERRILAALDRRLADRPVPPRADLPLAPGATPPVVVVVPGERPRPAVAPSVPVEPLAPRGEPVTQRPAAPGGTPLSLPETPRAPLDLTAVETEERVTVEEVERLILDTGLFRTTRVTFEFARAALLPSAQEVLDVVGEVLVRSPRLVIFVDGHTDHVGSDATNDRLSAARAAAVRDYLLARYPQIGPERIEARGFGERRPLASNETETGRALNRRVEFVVLNPGDADVTPPLPRRAEAP